MAHATSITRRGAGTVWESKMIGATRQTARNMKNCATTHPAAPIQKIASRSPVGSEEFRVVIADER